MVRARSIELAAASRPTRWRRGRTGRIWRVIVSSGGTTGIPKGSVRDFAAWTISVARPVPSDRRQLATGPVAYLTQILVAQTLIGGGIVVLRDDSDPAAPWRRSRPTGSPTCSLSSPSWSR